MASRLLNLISKKTNLHVQHAFFLSLLLFCTTTTLFCRTKTSNLLVTHYFYREIVVCACPKKARLFPPHPFFKGKALGTRLFLKVRAAMRFLSK